MGPTYGFFPAGARPSPNTLFKWHEPILPDEVVEEYRLFNTGNGKRKRSEDDEDYWMSSMRDMYNVQVFEMKTQIGAALTNLYILFILKYSYLIL